MTVTDHSRIHEDVRKKLNSGNAIYYVLQNLSSSLLISKNTNGRSFSNKSERMWKEAGVA